MKSVLIGFLIVLLSINFVCSISLLQSYRSPKSAIRRQGMANVRFRPVLFLKGEDDWRKQLGQETLTDAIMDENGIVFNTRPDHPDKLNNFFSRGSRLDGVGKK